MRTIQAIATHIIKTTEETNPTTLAEMCVQEATDEELASCFTYAIRAALREAAGKTRRAEQPTLTTKINGELVPVASARINAQREAWSAYKRTRVSIAGEWRLLGTLTYDECRTIAEERRTQAKHLSAKADEYDHLAEALTRHKATTVGELSDHILNTIKEAA